ncbi:MAG: hypothetical protein WD847_21105 [Pirellulales bacterium]
MVRHWQRVGPLLEQVRQRELRAMDDAAARVAIERVLELGAALPAVRTTSGLVEQQRLFQKWRR